MSKTIRFSVIIGLVALLIGVISNPQLTREGISKGLLLCVNVIIPSIFPFAALSLFLFNLLDGKNFYIRFLKINFDILSIIIMSFIGGYPIGAKLISDAYSRNRISRGNANILLMFCVNVGPSFVISGVGLNVFSSTKVGLILLGAHLISSVEIFFVFRKKLNIVIKSNKTEKQKLSIAFVNSVSAAANSMFIICGYVVLFGGLLELLNSLNISNHGKTILKCLLEVTGGIFSLNNIYLASFFLGFGGLCVILQVVAISKSFLTSVKNFIFSRCLHGILSMVNLFLLLKIFPVSLETISTNTKYIFKFNSINSIFSVLLLLFSVLLIYSLSNKQYCGKFEKDIL